MILVVRDQHGHIKETQERWRKPGAGAQNEVKHSTGPGDNLEDPETAPRRSDGTMRPGRPAPFAEPGGPDPNKVR